MLRKAGPQAAGKDPESPGGPLSSRSSCCIPVIDAQDAGSGPDSWFRCASKRRTAVMEPHEGGSAPVSWFDWKDRMDICLCGRHRRTGNVFEVLASALQKQMGW